MKGKAGSMSKRGKESRIKWMDPKERDVGTMGYLSLGFGFHFSSCSKSKAEFYYLKTTITIG